MLGKSLTSTEIQAMFTGGRGRPQRGERKGTNADNKSGNGEKRGGGGGNSSSRNTAPAFDTNGAPRCFNCNTYGHIARAFPKPRIPQDGKSVNTIQRQEQKAPPGQEEVTLSGKILSIEEGKE